MWMRMREVSVFAIDGPSDSATHAAMSASFLTANIVAICKEREREKMQLGSLVVGSEGKPRVRPIANRKKGDKSLSWF